MVYDPEDLIADIMQNLVNNNNKDEKDKEKNNNMPGSLNQALQIGLSKEPVTLGLGNKNEESMNDVSGTANIGDSNVSEF